MYLGTGIALVAIGLLLMLLVNWTVGVILLVVGVLAIAVSFMVTPRSRREVVIERDRPARSEVIREREL